MHPSNTSSGQLRRVLGALALSAVALLAAGAASPIKVRRTPVAVSAARRPAPLVMAVGRTTGGSR
jgi:hypothetical protein